MSDPRRLIEHVSERAPFPEDAFERMLRRRDRKRRNERLVAAGVVVVVILAVVALALRTFGPTGTVPGGVHTETGTVYTFFDGNTMVAVNGVKVETTSNHPKSPPGTPEPELDSRYVIRPMMDVSAGGVIDVGAEGARAWVDVHDLSEPAQRLYELDLAASPSMPEEPGTYYLELFIPDTPEALDGLTFLVPIRVTAPESS